MAMGKNMAMFNFILTPPLAFLFCQEINFESGHVFGHMIEMTGVD